MVDCSAQANRKPADKRFVYEGNDCPRIFWATDGYRIGHALPNHRASPGSQDCSGSAETITDAKIPLDWVRGVERLRRLPAHAPRIGGAVFLNDFDQFIHGRGGWAQRAADLGWDMLALSDVIQRARWTT